MFKMCLFFLEVTVTYKHGLPAITLTLPSRKERCQFTIRPMRMTVGDFLQDIQREDKAVEKVGVFAAGTNTAVALQSKITITTDMHVKSVGFGQFCLLYPRVEHVFVTSDVLCTTGRIRNCSFHFDTLEYLFIYLFLQRGLLQQRGEKTLLLQRLLVKGCGFPNDVLALHTIQSCTIKKEYKKYSCLQLHLSRLTVHISL